MSTLKSAAVSLPTVRDATQFRSTWLTSSLRALRERQLLEPYFAHLPRALHDTVRASVAGTWLPIEVAIAHYEACDSLKLPLSDQLAMGREVTRFAHRTAYSMVLRLANEAGVTPWSSFAIQQRLWRQVWIGGDVVTRRLGPKEAGVDVMGWPCSRIAYCRNAMRGLLSGQAELFCKKAYVSDVPSGCSPTSLSYRVAWA